MMRKYNFVYLFIFMICLFIMCEKIEAREYKCSYKVQNNAWALNFYYSINEENNSVKIGIYDFSSSEVSHIADFYLDETLKNIDSFEEKKRYFIQNLDGHCPEIVTVVQGSGLHYMFLIDSQYEGQAMNIKSVAGDEISGEAFVGNLFGKNHIFHASLDDSNSNGIVVEKISFICSLYNEFVNGDEEDCGDDNNKNYSLKCYFDKCNNQGDISACNKYNSRKSELKSYCNSIMQYSIYSSPCIQSCIGMPDLIAQIESKKIGDGTCNVSDRIIKWVANILKWGKYFAPVLAIILSILDFIKAIASQNDEEMKKTQARFVKRIIVAALLFLIPFIIEFALDVFNLVKDNPYCDLL